MSLRTNIERVRMAEHITNHGVLQGDDLRAALEWQLEQFTDAVDGTPDRWFEQTVGGWDLTMCGREGLTLARGFAPMHGNDGTRAHR